MNYADELYNYIKERFSLNNVIVCDLHKPCLPNRQCRSPQNNTKVLNFDTVMTCFCKSEGKVTAPSVDGLTCKKCVVIFVEIKGWKKYIAYTKNITDEKINKQVSSYKFPYYILL